MSRIRAALERRSSLAADVASAFPGDVTGTTGWGPGMTWQGYGASTVGTDAAMRLSAVYACLRLLSEAISTLPLDTYRRINGTRLPYRPRPDYLSFQPPQGSRIEYLSQVMLSLLTDGNAFVWTPRDRLGIPLDLLCLDPGRVTVEKVRNRIRFTVGGVYLDESEIMHIKGMTMPGELRGVSPIAAARSIIDGALKAQDFGSSYIGNAAVPPAYISFTSTGGDPKVEKERALRVGEAWNASNGGTANAGKVGVLTNAELKTVAVSPADSQWMESRQFGVQEVARIYGVPPHLIADSSNSTSWGSGLAEQNLAFGQLSLRPWLERIEDGHGRLLTSHGLPDVFVKLNLDALLRASLKDRYDADAIGINAGFLTINEARSLEDLPPVKWGDEPFTPMAQSPAPGGAQ